MTPTDAPRAPERRYLVNPGDDEVFQRAVEALGASSGTVEALQVRLRVRYPDALVRARDLTDEPLVTWYVYRDGQWVFTQLVPSSRGGRRNPGAYTPSTHDGTDPGRLARSETSMDGDGAPDPQALAEAAAQRALDTERSARAAEQSVAERDQDAADADQTASDQDQAGAERDDADALRDQEASDQDQAAAEGLRPDVGPRLDAWVANREAREVTRLDRLATHAARATTGRTRLATAIERDATAAARDEAARRRDDRSAARVQAIAGSDVPSDDRVEALRAEAAATRDRAASARADAAADRERAARDRAACAQERERLERDLRSAHLDALTGALRREIGWLTLGHEIARAHRGDGRLVVAYVDVDDMKGVNDRSGHGAGDHVLQRLVWEIRGNLRAYDPVIRVGGDEFVCGLAGAHVADAQQRFARIAGNVHDELRVGISVGLAELAPQDSVDDLVGRADLALLHARRME